MHGTAKSLKTNDREHDEIRIAPLKLPRHFAAVQNPTAPNGMSASGPKSRGADGKPTKTL
jgi:hypothetical protein